VNDKWLDANVIKENPFNKRISDVRRATQMNMEAMAAVEYLRSGQGAHSGSNPVVQQHPQQNSQQNQQQSQYQTLHQNTSMTNSQIMSPQRVSGTFNTESGFASRTPPSYSQSGVFQRADVVVRELSDDEIDQKAFYDTTSEAYNLRFTLRTLHSELMRAQSFNRSVSIMVVAIDRFKDLGLDYGALALDSMVSTAVTTLMTTCRAVDMVGRFMEDRFIVVLPETDLRSASVIAEKVRVAFEAIAIPHQWHTIRFHANIGLAEFPTHGTDVESFIALADYASDSVAAKGGNGVLLAPNV
jgi:diguanylate cyclase (GGDEF)-like protein